MFRLIEGSFRTLHRPRNSLGVNQMRQDSAESHPWIGEPLPSPPPTGKRKAPPPPGRRSRRSKRVSRIDARRWVENQMRVS